MSYTYLFSLAEIPFQLTSEHPHNDLRPFLTSTEPKEILKAECGVKSKRYSAAPEYLTPSAVEYLWLIGEVGRVLLKYDCCLFHGAAFLWHEKAWIFTAPSGTGKTTQYNLLKERYGDEIQILNGDKPVLVFHEDGAVMVHPSPWNGKENLGCMKTAPLGGLILLKQGLENQVRLMEPSSLIIPLYYQIFLQCGTPEEVDQAMKLETMLIEHFPVWELTNCGDLSSAELMHDTLLRWEKQ